MRLVRVVEARADADAANILADRVFIEGDAGWIDAEMLPSLRDWTGVDPQTPYTRWLGLGQLAAGDGSCSTGQNNSARHQFGHLLPDWQPAGRTNSQRQVWRFTDVDVAWLDGCGVIDKRSTLGQAAATAQNRLMPQEGPSSAVGRQPTYQLVERPLGDNAIRLL